jgi:hypothetical protein
MVFKMISSWLRAALDCAKTKADFYSGCRKILRGQTIDFDLANDLQLRHSGYTKSKASMLRRNYLHVESRETAKLLWERRLEQDKYGSVGFTTYNHFMKGQHKGSDKIEGTSKRASVMGPCIQSVVLTLMHDKSTAVDVFYRTTEMFKKFPADLVFIRDELLGNSFHLTRPTLTCYFANITAHPMYFITLVPSLNDPILSFENIKKKDKYFYDWCVKWSARYVCKEYSRGIDKFSQALRVRKDAYDRIDKDKLRELQKYLKKNHPGYRNSYQGDIDGDDD